MKATGPYALCSVDVWDTLLRRRCHPDAVKLHSAKLLLLRADQYIAAPLRTPRALLALRLTIERDLARTARAAGHDNEFRLTDVLTGWLARACPNAAFMHAALASQLADEEYAQEAYVSYADPGIEKRLARIEAARWIFASDFYMPAARLQALLADKGLGSRFQAGYSSADFLLRKSSGRLFGVIQSQHGIAPTQHCHIGDNVLSDVKVPRHLGMQALRYTHHAQERLRRTRARYLDDRAALFRELRRRSRVVRPSAGVPAQRAWRCGVRLVPLFAGFALYIAESAQRDGVKRLLFCTREGEFFAKIYSALVQAHPQLARRLPPTQLLEVSRRSTFAASLTTPSTSEMMRLWRDYPKQSPATWGWSLGLDTSQVASWCARHALPFDEIIERPWQDARMQCLLDDADVITTMTQHTARSRTSLRAYLHTLDLPEDGTLGLVDIGWRGSILDNLARVLPQAQWHGYYLGLQAFLDAPPANVRKSAYGPDLNPAGGKSPLFADLPLLELLCGAPGGSVTGYAPNADGTMRAMRDADVDEDAALLGIVGQIQAGILDGLPIWAEAIHVHALSSTELRPQALALWAQLLRRPPRFLIEAQRQHKHDERFGRGRFAPMPPRNSWLAKKLRRATGAANSAAAEEQPADGADIP